MQLSQESSAGLLIRSCTPDELVIGTERWRQSVLIMPDGELRRWAPSAIERLQPADLQAAVASRPQILLIGTGTIQRFPSQRLLTGILREGIGVEVMDTAAACRTYNVLACEGRSVCAALLVAAG